jgi:hypothetical protein
MATQNIKQTRGGNSFFGLDERAGASPDAPRKGASQFLDNRKRCVPKGSRLGGKNSPAFERRGLTVSQQVPQGRLKKRFFSAVPAGLGGFPNLSRH